MKPKKRARKPKKPAKRAAATAGIEEYFPIVAGRAYVYRYESAEWPQKSTSTMRVKSVSQAAGKTTAVWEETKPDPPDPKWPSIHKWTVERSAEGVMEGTKDWSWWSIRTPLRKGAPWAREGGTEARIKSLTARVKVPAGVFKNCLHITYWNEDIGWGELYYAKGVGLVRSNQGGEWVPYDYWLESVGQEDAGAAPLAAAVEGRPRMMAAKGK